MLLKKQKPRFNCFYTYRIYIRRKPYCPRVKLNESGETYVAWAWKAGGNSNTFNINDVGYSSASAAGLTAGTISLTRASVNTKTQFRYSWI
jgi:hypothetical protein